MPKTLGSSGVETIESKMLSTAETVPHLMLVSLFKKGISISADESEGHLRRK